ncbi:MAG: Mediator of RNA polymerase II transcription subunit 6, partial [Paramarteilia canceri]
MGSFQEVLESWREDVRLSQLSWHDPVFAAVLRADNALEYFQQASNPFYDKTCNNEVIRMQRLDLARLV